MAPDFAQSIERSIALAEQLEGLLLDEGGALGARNTDSLREIVILKEQVTRALETETQCQRQWISDAGLDFDPQGLHQYLERQPDRPRLEEQWRLLRETVRRCERLNRDNADLIQRQRRRVDQSLRLLRGDDGVSTTYDPSGRTASAVRSRSLSRA